jgi:hypothetical protein
MGGTTAEVAGLLAWTGEWWATSRDQGDAHAGVGSIRQTTKTKTGENRRLRFSEGRTLGRQATLVALIYILGECPCVATGVKKLYETYIMPKEDLGRIIGVNIF